MSTLMRQLTGAGFASSPKTPSLLLQVEELTQVGTPWFQTGSTSLSGLRVLMRSYLTCRRKSRLIVEIPWVIICREP